MKIIHVVGARPNFMKMSPAFRALEKHSGIKQIVVHTGQHYDRSMSAIFFEQLGIREPDENLAVGSGSHAVMTAQVMIRFEEVVLKESPDMVLVYGDVNSTVAATLVATKLGITVGHVEAGLRSRDRTMPEELNRLVTDQLADHLFTPSEDADRNLQQEGVAPEKIHFVGNLMIDTLVRLLEYAKPPQIGTIADRYLLVTLHRPSNVDDPAMLQQIIGTLNELSRDIQVIFPIHPRTRASLEELGSLPNGDDLKLTEPLGYLEFLALQKNAVAVITDSGGIQEEATFLNVPCLTVRENTERPVTVEIGTNVLVGRDMSLLTQQVRSILKGNVKTGSIPPLWDGHAGERVAEIVSHL